jgi:hypothetical protein
LQTEGGLSNEQLLGSPGNVACLNDASEIAKLTDVDRSFLSVSLPLVSKKPEYFIPPAGGRSVRMTYSCDTGIALTLGSANKKRLSIDSQSFQSTAVAGHRCHM